MHIPLYTYILISYDINNICLILRSIVYSYVDIRMPAFVPIYRLIRMSLPRWVNSMTCYCQRTLLWNVSARDIT